MQQGGAGSGGEWGCSARAQEAGGVSLRLGLSPLNTTFMMVPARGFRVWHRYRTGHWRNALGHAASPHLPGPEKGKACRWEPHSPRAPSPASTSPS